MIKMFWVVFIGALVLVLLVIPGAIIWRRAMKIPLDTGLLTHDRVKYIEDLIADTKAGCPHELSETRCFKTVGMGIFDARAGQLVYEKALERGIGKNIAW